MRPAFRSLRAQVRHLLRARPLAAFAVFVAVAVAMLLVARGIPQYRQNLALNLAAELVGTFVILFALTPIMRRAQESGVREHRRLDFDWYTDRVRGAMTRARILHTFSRLFGPPFDRRFMDASVRLLGAGGHVQILLLHPDSDAAVQRTAELSGRTDVAQQTRRNLRLLAEHRQSLDKHVRHRFEVRLYATAPSVQVYQWDNRLLASFFPVGRLSGDHVQLEVSAESPLGYFVTERFDDLWARSTALDDYMSLTILVSDSMGKGEYSSPFVVLDGRHYLADPQVIARRGRNDNDVVVRATLRHVPDETYVVDFVDEGSRLADRVSVRFEEKYDRRETAFVFLDRET
jgi:hypothetical protein